MFAFRIIRRVISAIILLAIVIPLVAGGKTWMAARDSTAGKADVIVVLGAAQFDGRPSEVFESRLVEAKRIFLLGYAPSIITVGSGAPGDRTTEAASAKKWLLSNGIKSVNVTAIEEGRDTFVSTESYIALMKAKGWESVIIVTDPYHCLRAMTMASDLGARATCSPARTGVNSLENFNVRYLIRETGAYLAYITLGRRGIHVSDHLGRE
ncbi:MAG: YdcF family protein [Actinobacteria bacterium]|nr:YdcF family protein [Actinomycetota bacterium]